MPVKQSQKPANELPQKLIRYAQILAQGGKSNTQAAIEAGYSRKTANAHAYRWLGKSRSDAEYPALWDVYEPLKDERLRLFGITADAVLHELKIIAYSSIDNYLDLPSKEVHDDVNAAADKIRKLSETIHKKHTRFPTDGDLLLDPKAKPEILASAKPLLDKIEALEKKISGLKAGPGFYLRLKFKEDIPAELIPAIAEIKETREGIVVKLHNKLDGLDKLGRFLNIFAGDADKDKDKLAQIKELVLEVNGSRSTMRVNNDEKAA